MQEAEESVVVINPWPMKAGNRPEEKTKGTSYLVMMGYEQPKEFISAKGGRKLKCMNCAFYL